MLDLLVSLNEVKNAQNKLIMNSKLHLTYLLMPDDIGIHIDWSEFMKIFNSLNENDLNVAKILDISYDSIQYFRKNYREKINLDVKYNKEKDLFVLNSLNIIQIKHKKFYNSLLILKKINYDSETQSQTDLMDINFNNERIV